jgi:hypothetical protein
MDRHRLAEERSLAYHAVIAERLGREPQLLELAQTRVRAWLARGEPAPFYAREWAFILEQSLASIVGFLVDRGERACELRQSTPFAGALSARERWRIWHETGERNAEHS